MTLQDPLTSTGGRHTADDVARLLAATPLFSELRSETIDSLAKGADVRRYGAGETAYTAGQYDGGEAFVVADGVLSLSHVDPETGAAVVTLLRRGDIFGLEYALTGAADPADRVTIVAETPAALIGFDAALLQGEAASRPDFVNALMRDFARRLAAAPISNVRPATSPAQRVYVELLANAVRADDCGVWRVTRLPKHRELAERAKTTEQVVAGAIADLIRDGIVRRSYPGLEIDDITRLERIAS